MRDKAMPLGKKFKVRLSRNELGDLEDILQSIANEEKELRGGR